MRLGLAYFMLTAVLSNVNVQLRCVSQPVLNNHISWFFPLTNSLSCCSVPLLSKSDIEGLECERVLSASLFNNNKNHFPFTPLVTFNLLISAYIRWTKQSYRSWSSSTHPACIWDINFPSPELPTHCSNYNLTHFVLLHAEHLLEHLPDIITLPACLKTLWEIGLINIL